MDQRKHHQIAPGQPDQAQQRQITLLSFHIGIKPNTKRDEIPNPTEPREQGEKQREATIKAEQAFHLFRKRFHLHPIAPQIMVNARYIFQAPRMGAKTGKDACGIIRDIGWRGGGRQRAISEAIHQQQSLEVHKNAVAAKSARRRDGSDGDGKIQYLSCAGITAKGAQRHIHAWLQIQARGEGGAWDDLVRRNSGQAMQQGITRGSGQQFRAQHGAGARRVFEARFSIQAARTRNDKGDIGPRGQAC